MSKKTDNIYKSFKKLDSLQNALENKNKDIQDRDLDSIQFEFKQELKTLKFWFESLYSYNGKSKSLAKKKSSKENGKLGGRPPKWVTSARRRILEINENLIPELEHSIKLGDFENEDKLKNQLAEIQNEADMLNKKLLSWESSKK